MTKSISNKLIETYNMPIVAIRANKKFNTPGQIKKVIHLAEELNIPTIILRAPYFTEF